jgi:hypothetical protein
MESNPTPQQLALIEQLKPYAPDETTYGRMYADLHDLLEASAWLLDTFARHQGESLSASQMEALLIDIDVKFAEHASYHLRTLRRDIEATLARFPQSDAESRDSSASGE